MRHGEEFTLTIWAETIPLQRCKSYQSTSPPLRRIPKKPPSSKSKLCDGVRAVGQVRPAVAKFFLV
eukprot:3808668-Rhodomonas_salina.1